jgi:hypothetical protein
VDLVKSRIPLLEGAARGDYPVHTGQVKPGSRQNAMRSPDTIRASSAEIGAAFAQWLERMRAARVQLVVLEGMLDAGKADLTRGHPFAVEADRFLRRAVAPETPYPEAVDQRALRSAILRALDAFPLSVVEGPMVWPLLRPLPVERLRVRRVYLKRMMHRQPDVWQDERAIASRDLWPRRAFKRSIVRYHHDERPWHAADLVLERIEPGEEGGHA